MTADAKTPPVVTGDKTGTDDASSSGEGNGTETANTHLTQAGDGKAPDGSPSPVANREVPYVPTKSREPLEVGKRFSFTAPHGRIQNPNTLQWFGEDGPKKATVDAWVNMQYTADVPKLDIVLED